MRRASSLRIQKSSSRVAGRLDRLAAELHHAIGVRHGADLLGPRGRGQHDVGEVRRFGEEDVLHDQMIERGERLAGVIDVRIGHRRVFAHDVHAADLVLLGGVHDLDDGEARIRIELRVPQLLEPLPRSGRAHALIVRIEHRNQSRVRRALHVVLSAQRMQSRAGLADLAGRERQRDQAARVVGAVNVLRNAHAPEDHRALRRRVQPGDLADRLRVDAADRRHRFR